jgi:predicted DNA-binding transcriptional regulator AlpA
MSSELKLLRYEDLVRETGLSRTTIWRYWKSGKFPCPIKVGNGTPLWRECELIDWLKSLSHADGSRHPQVVDKINLG